MKRLLFLITTILIFITKLVLPVSADIMPGKVLNVNYDNSSAIVAITTQDISVDSEQNLPLKFVRLNNPNRIYFDINNSILVGEKKQIVFEKSKIKEVRVAQFENNPNKIVRVVITFEEDYDTSKVKVLNAGGVIIIKLDKLDLINDYFNVIYDESTSNKQEYSGIVASSQVIQKLTIPVAEPENSSNSTIKDIQSAFGDTTLSNTDGKTYDSVISIDLSGKLKLRTKYYINQYIPKNEGLLVSGVGQITTAGMFYLNTPKRMVIDLPNTYLDKFIRNREISLCPTGACKDSAKIGQFDYNTARIVITSENAEKYIPIYAKDSQSLFLINSDKLNHRALENTVSNINKVFVKKIDSKTSELIISFTAPIVHSILRTDNSINLYMFNVRSYNEQDISKTLMNSAYKQLTLSLLPQIGVKAGMRINKKDVVKIEESLDARALKITITKNSEDTSKSAEKPVKKNNQNKNNVVLDPGHGGSDYGAIREGVNEKDITLDISKRVESILKSKGYKVSLTRTDDIFVSLEDRVAFSEERSPEIFVSIHVNSAVSTDPNGIETHWYHDYSKSLAEIVHKHFINELPNSKDRGLFKSKFYVINHTTCPAILCEIGFLSNESERNELLTESRKQKTAKAIAEGIIEYIRGGK